MNGGSPPRGDSRTSTTTLAEQRQLVEHVVAREALRPAPPERRIAQQGVQLGGGGGGERLGRASAQVLGARRGAFTIAGRMDGSDDHVLVLGPEDVAALLDPAALLDALAAAFAAASRGEVEAPPRSELALGAAAGCW